MNEGKVIVERKTGGKMKHNNCLFFAMQKAINEGNYIVIRRTRKEHKWPIKWHFLVIPKELVDKYALSFVPVNEATEDYPWPLFEGYVKKGDK